MAEQHTNFWPTSLRQPLLRAAFLSGDAAIQAWEEWKSQVNMADHPDLGSFRLLPQLHRNLQQLGVDDPLMMKLKGIARQRWYKNQEFFRSLAAPLTILHQAGLKCLLLYGPAMALDCYRDYALGSDSNLAILVPPNQALPAMKCLQSLGWQPEGEIPETILDEYLATGWMHFFRDAVNRRVHLHWHLLPECSQAEADDDFWSGAVATKVHDVPVYNLNPADQLLHVCVQDSSLAETDLFLRAIDAMLIIKANPHLDWDRLIRQAEKYRLGVPLLKVLNYVQSNLDEPLPAELWQRLKLLSTAWPEHVEYKLKNSRPVVWQRFWRLWFNYRRRFPDSSLPQSIVGYPQYLQYFWRVEEAGQTPAKAMSIVRHRLWRNHSEIDIS